MLEEPWFDIIVVHKLDVLGEHGVDDEEGGGSEEDDEKADENDLFLGFIDSNSFSHV